MFLTVTYECRDGVFGWVAFGGNIDRSLDHAVPLQMLRRAKVCQMLLASVPVCPGVGRPLPGDTF